MIGYTEVQPGSYVLMDRQYGENHWDGQFRPRNGLYLASTVMSAPRDGRVICDVGLKSVAVDADMPALAQGPATSVAPSTWAYVLANDEHGIIDLVDSGGVGHSPRLGERLYLTLGHVDPTANLHDQYICFRGATVEEIWPVDARGLSR
jgi:D-serine deaminase-like pyridoxal phosphate-dependent protein